MFPSPPSHDFPQPSSQTNPPDNTTTVVERRSSSNHRPPEDVIDHHHPNQPQQQQQQPTGLRCPRCDSTNTKFCYYNNYSLAQPRHFCKTCRRYWTNGGAIRNIPIGGGCRKNKKTRFINPGGSTSSSSITGGGHELSLFQGIHFDTSPAMLLGYNPSGSNSFPAPPPPPPRFSLYNNNNHSQNNYMSTIGNQLHNGSNHVISFNPLQSYLQSPPPQMSGGAHHHHPHNHHNQSSIDLTGGGGSGTSGTRSLGLNFNTHNSSSTTTATNGMMCTQFGEISGATNSNTMITSPVGSGTSLITTCIESLSSINQELHLKLQQQRLALYYGGGGVLVSGGTVGKGSNVNAEENKQQQGGSVTVTPDETEKPQPIFFQSLEVATSNNNNNNNCETSYGKSPREGMEWGFGDRNNDEINVHTTAAASSTTSGFGGSTAVNWPTENPFSFSNLIGLDKN